MLPNRIRISKDASEHLRFIKGRTGVTPNILCRIAFIKSLANGTNFSKGEISLDGLDFNLTTLFGDYCNLYNALMINKYGIIESKQAEMILAIHIQDGVKSMRGIKTLTDLC